MPYLPCAGMDWGADWMALSVWLRAFEWAVKNRWRKGSEHVGRTKGTLSAVLFLYCWMPEFPRPESDVPVYFWNRFFQSCTVRCNILIFRTNMTIRDYMCWNDNEFCLDEKVDKIYWKGLTLLPYIGWLKKNCRNFILFRTFPYFSTSSSRW